jgi:VWFA-related protein
VIPRALSLILVLINLPLTFAQQPASPQSSPPQKPATTQKQTLPEVDSQDVVKINTNLVQIDVSVTRDGKPVTDLQPEDFEIFSDGKPQKITNFSYVSNVTGDISSASPSRAKTKDKIATPVAPAKVSMGQARRMVAIMVDDLGMAFNTVASVRRQLRKFIDEELAPNDLVAIIRTGGDVGALQQFTNDKRVLADAVDHLKWNHCTRVGVDVFEQVGVPSARERTQTGQDYGPCGQTRSDSIRASLRIFHFVLRGMHYLPGRKSMVILSDDLPISVDMAGEGADVAEPRSLEGALHRVVEEAIRSAVVIYAADTRGLAYTGLTASDSVKFPPRGGGNMSPEQLLVALRNQRMASLINNRTGSDLLSRQTGGFLVANSNDFGFKQIMNDQQGYYLIGFRPSDETFNKSFHHLKATVKGSGLTVRTRSGFYGFSDDEIRAAVFTPADEINKALISPFGAQNIKLRLTSFFVDDPKDGPLVRSLLYFDPQNVTFQPRDGWQVATLKIKTMVFGDNGVPVAEEERDGNIRFRGEAYERALREGFSYSIDFPIKLKGAFQVRVAVRDENTAKLGSAGEFVQLPNLSDGRLAMSGIVARPAVTDESAEPVANGPAVRQFHEGSAVTFAYSIYNARRSTELSTQLQLFRDGVNVFTGPAVAIDHAGQEPLTNVLKFELGSKFAPGHYICQIIVTDLSDKKKPGVASQWIDFEIVK